jgi:agmatinase
MITNNNIYNFIGFDSSYEDSELIVFGVPYDGTVSFRPGTRFGPQAIRIDSDGLETYSPYQNKDILDMSICDMGDIEIPFGNTNKVLTDIEDYAKDIIKDNKKTLMIGGEHLVSYPVIKAFSEKYNDLHVIHFDAHTDLRQDYMGEKFSHATVMRRSYEHLGKGTIWQFGIRSGTKEEFQWANTNINTNKFDFSGLEEAINSIGDYPVYVSIDLDVLDPSVFPGTGTPEAGGVTFKELIDAILQLSKLNIVGCDIVELAPHYDTSGVSTAVACKVVRELAIIMNS